MDFSSTVFYEGHDSVKPPPMREPTPMSHSRVSVPVVSPLEMFLHADKVIILQ
jgi:hypothetical protein